MYVHTHTHTMRRGRAGGARGSLPDGWHLTEKWILKLPTSSLDVWMYVVVGMQVRMYRTYVPTWMPTHGSIYCMQKTYIQSNSGLQPGNYIQRIKGGREELPWLMDPRADWGVLVVSSRVSIPPSPHPRGPQNT